MHSKITTEISICQAENGFSWDELVKKLADAFENKAFADILKMNLQLTQEILIYRIFNDHDNQQFILFRSPVQAAKNRPCREYCRIYGTCRAESRKVSKLHYAACPAPGAAE